MIPCLLGAANHVDVQLSNDTVDWDRRVIRKELGAPEALFLTAVPYKDQRTLWLGALCECLSDLQNTRSARAIIIRAIEDTVCTFRSIVAYTNVVVVCTNRNVFRLQLRIGSFDNPNHVLCALAGDIAGYGELGNLSRCKCLALGCFAVRGRRKVHAFAIHQSSANGRAYGNGRNCWNDFRWVLDTAKVRTAVRLLKLADFLLPGCIIASGQNHDANRTKLLRNGGRREEIDTRFSILPRHIRRHCGGDNEDFTLDI